MKRILITGANSYIGTSFEHYVEQWPDQYRVDTFDMVDGSWREKSFAGYDAVFHVAGIAHSDSGKISAERQTLYYEVNTNLTIETAKKAKADGVKQFIFMSSIIVYGDSAPIGKQKIIKKETMPSPANCYGDSKLKAENGILPLQNDAFNVVVLRPPMIYGKGCKGNFYILEKLAARLPIFPYVENQRSMLYIGNLVEFIRRIIEDNEKGIFWPQNSEYVNTSLLIKSIAATRGKNIRLIKGFTWAMRLAGHLTGKINKAFGNLIYDKSMHECGNYNRYGLDDSIKLMENAQAPHKAIEGKALMIASVASMIDLFNMNNISILESLGYKVDVAANFHAGSVTGQARVDEFKKELKAKGIGAIDMPIPRSISKISDIISSYRLVKDICDKNQYGLVHCHSPIGGAVARLGGKKARGKYGTKIIYTAHGFHFFKGAPLKNWLLYYPVEKYLSRYTDVLITINQEDFNMAMSRRFKAKQIKFVHGVGVDLNKFQACDMGKKLQLRKEYGYKEKDFILFYAAELNGNKHQALLIHAVKKLKQKMPGIKLLLAGNGVLENQYKKQAQELGVDANIDFLGFRSDVKSLLLLSDIAVASSKREGLGVNVMEAMATGLPLVVTNIRGHRDLVSDGENGYLVEKNSVEGFVHAIEKLYEDEALRCAFGEKGVELVQKYALNSVLYEMKAIYEFQFEENA